MSEIRTKVQFVDIDEDMAGQRIDNFLRNQLKNLPKSMIYRILRKGEVRVNKKRIKAEYKLQAGDIVRIPPVTIEEKSDKDIAPSTKLDKVAELEHLIIYEDEHLLVLNKPLAPQYTGAVDLNSVRLKPCGHCALKRVFSNWCTVSTETPLVFCWWQKSALR